MHSDAELYNKVEAHSNFEISVHERDIELLGSEVHSDLEVGRRNVEARAKPRLSKYVKRYHLLHKSLEIKILDQ